MQFVILNIIFQFEGSYERPLGAVIIVVRLSFPKIVDANLPSTQDIF